MILLFIYLLVLFLFFYPQPMFPLNLPNFAFFYFTLHFAASLGKNKKKLSTAPSGGGANLLDLVTDASYISLSVSC